MLPIWSGTVQHAGVDGGRNMVEEVTFEEIDALDG